MKTIGSYGAARRPSIPLWILIASILVLVAIWMVAVSLGDDLIRQLSRVSASVASYRRNPGLILGLGFVVCTLCLVFAYALLAARPAMFMALWLMALALGDARLGIIQQGGLLLRYSMMLMLVILGVRVLLRGGSKVGGRWLVGLFLAYTGIQWAHLLIDGPTIPSLAILPIQLALAVGVMFGVRDLMMSDDFILRLGRALAYAGIAMTVIACLSLVGAEQPFLAGRFRSWHALPTGFATGYVCFLIPLIWVSWSGGDRLLRLCSVIAACVGVVLIVLSGTRNALLCALLSTFVMLVFWRRRLIFPLMLAALVLLLLASAMDQGAAVFGGAGQRIVSGEQTRFGVWGISWDFIQQKTLWGYGLVPDLQVFNIRRNEIQIVDAHSSYLGTWLRLGIVGLLIVVAINLLALVQAASIWSRISRWREGANVLMLLACLLLTVIVGGVFEDNLSGRGNVQQAVWAIAIAGITALHARVSRGRGVVA